MRPWPVPSSPYVMHQRWSDLLFAHWRVPVESIRGRVPEELPIDSFDGSAWVGVIPFRMSNVRPRYLPPIPVLSAFPELNVRTYVTIADKPGVYFFSLDAGNTLAVIGARLAFGLPYFRAWMRVIRVGQHVSYRSTRIHPGAAAARLSTRYRSTGKPFRAEPGTLQHFLTERYCLYNVVARRVLRLEIDHPPWDLEPAEANFDENTMAQAAGIPLPPDSPHLLFSRRQDMVAWLPERVAE